jgi:antitoxin MazE
MQIAKWGNSLAVRLPAQLVLRLGLKAGDEIDVVPAVAADGGVRLEVARQQTREEILAGLDRYRGRLEGHYKFDRDEANQR